MGGGELEILESFVSLFFLPPGQSVWRRLTRMGPLLCFPALLNLGISAAVWDGPVEGEPCGGLAPL